MARQFDIFLSHSHQDREWARQLARALAERGLRVWFDADQIKAGENWRSSILEGLQRSSHIVFLVGRGAAQSNSLGLELGMALAQDKRIIPIVDKDTPAAEIPGPIRRRQYIEKADPQTIADEIAETVAAPTRAMV